MLRPLAYGALQKVPRVHGGVLPPPLPMGQPLLRIEMVFLPLKVIERCLDPAVPQPCEPVSVFKKTLPCKLPTILVTVPWPSAHCEVDCDFLRNDRSIRPYLPICLPVATRPLPWL